MPNETQRPFAITEQTGCSGAVSNLTNDPDSGTDGNWVTADSNSGDIALRVNFRDASGSLTTGTGLQEFRARVVESVIGDSPDNVTMQVYEGNTLRATIYNVDNPSYGTGGAVISGTWDASILSTQAASADVQCRIVCTADTSPPPQVSSLDVDSIEWNLTYDGATTQTVTASARAYLQEAGKTQAASARAYLQEGGNTESASARAYVQAVGTELTALADAILKAVGSTETAGADAYLRQTDSQLTAEIGALLAEAAKEVSAETVAYLKAVGSTETALAEAFLRSGGNEITAAAAAYLRQAGNELTAQARAVLQALARTEQVSADAYLRTVGNGISAAADAYLRALGSTETSAADAYLQASQQITASLDAWLETVGAGAVVQILEKNGAGASATNKTNGSIVFCNADSANPGTTNPMVRPGAGVDYSWEKWTRLNVQTAPDTNISNLRYYTSGALDTGATLYAKTETVYATPSEVTGAAGYTDASSYTSGAPLSLGAGPYTGTGQHGDHAVMMLTVGPAVGPGQGTAITLHYSYDEI